MNGKRDTTNSNAFDRWTRMMIGFMIFAKSLALFAATGTAARDKARTQLVPIKGEVHFVAVGNPGFLRVRGESTNAPTGVLLHEEGQIKGTLSFNLSDLKTGIDLRDKHMKDKYLEVEKFPTAELELQPVKLPEGLTSDSSGDFTGMLTLHGNKKEVKGKYTFAAKDNKAKVNFSVLVSDFKIEIPKYLGVTISESVDLEVTVVFKSETKAL